MSDEFDEKLEQHRIDFTQVTGEQFKHFFCPILCSSFYKRFSRSEKFG